MLARVRRPRRAAGCCKPLASKPPKNTTRARRSLVCVLTRPRPARPARSPPPRPPARGTHAESARGRAPAADSSAHGEAEARNLRRCPCLKAPAAGVRTRTERADRGAPSERVLIARAPSTGSFAAALASVAFSPSRGAQRGHLSRSSRPCTLAFERQLAGTNAPDSEAEAPLEALRDRELATEILVVARARSVRRVGQQQRHSLGHDRRAHERACRSAGATDGREGRGADRAGEHEEKA